MYTLKDACRLTGLSEHTIRYYTDIGLVPHLKRDNHNRRIFDEEALDWLKGTKYLRDLGLSIEEIKQYHIYCQTDNDEGIKRRYQIIHKALISAKKEVEEAKQRVLFLEKKLAHETDILEHKTLDLKNPHKKYMKKQ